MYALRAPNPISRYISLLRWLILADQEKWMDQGNAALKEAAMPSNMPLHFVSEPRENEEPIDQASDTEVKD